jgi:hypothetical protein
MKKLSLYIYIAFLASTFSCERLADYRGALPARKLVLYSFAEPDSLLRVEIGATRRPLSGEMEDTPTGITGEVHLNGVLADTLRPPVAPSSAYTTTITPSPGDHVRIIARAPGFREASAEVTLPASGVTIRVDTTHVAPGGKLERVRYAIHVDDDGRERRYFRLVLETENASYVNGILQDISRTHAFDPENDPLLVGNDNTWLHEDIVPNRYHLFTNETFAGRGYTLHVSAAAHESYHFTYDSGGQPVLQRDVLRQRVRLARVDESTYRHLKSIMLAELGEGVMEPVQVYTNVRDGVGVVGYSWFTTVVFQMPDRLLVDPPIYSNQ